MGLLNWFAKKSIEKGESNLRKSLAALVPAADASWAATESAMSAGMPLPKADPRVREFQKQLLEVLTTWKGPLPDEDAAAIAGEVIRASGGLGAQMAVRTVFLEWWPEHGKPSLTVEQLESYVGSRLDDEEMVRAVQRYLASRAG